MSAKIDDLPLDESADASVLAQAKRDHAEAQAEQKQDKPVSLLRIAELRHKARERLIKEGRLVEVLRADAALEGSVSDAEDTAHRLERRRQIDRPRAERSSDGFRYNSISGKAQWQDELIYGQGRETNNPGAQSTLTHKYVRAWANFVAAKALGAVPGVEPGAEQITALARGMYLVYAADLGWRRSYDQSPMRRWSTSDVIADGEPKLFGGAAKYAMNDGSSAGELESDAWHAVARAFFDAVAACVNGGPPLQNLGPSLYHAYTEHLGGKSSYADHEALPGWNEIHDTDQRAWRLAAKHAWGQL